MRLDRAMATLVASFVFCAPIGICAVAAITSVTSMAACGSSLPFPPSIATPPSDFVDVPYPPPAARVEFVPPRPNGSALWIDGAWTRDGSRWRWKRGGWFEVPPGVFYSPWETRRPDGTRLLFANPAWRDAKGAVVADPKRLVQAQTNFNEESHDYKKLDAGDFDSEAAANLTSLPNSDSVSDSGLLAQRLWGDASWDDSSSRDAASSASITPALSDAAVAHPLSDAALDGGASK